MRKICMVKSRPTVTCEYPLTWWVPVTDINFWMDSNIFFMCLGLGRQNLRDHRISRTSILRVVRASEIPRCRSWGRRPTTGAGDEHPVELWLSAIELELSKKQPPKFSIVFQLRVPQLAWAPGPSARTPPLQSRAPLLSTLLLRLLKHHLPIKQHVASSSVPGDEAGHGWAATGARRWRHRLLFFFLRDVWIVHPSRPSRSNSCGQGEDWFGFGGPNSWD